MNTLARSFLGLAVAGLASAVAGCGATSDKGSDWPTTLVGNPAPDFSVATVTNGSGNVSLKDLRGKVVLVDFWGTYCEPCQKSFPKLQDLNTKYSTSGLKIVGISEDEPEQKDDIPGFADKYGAKFTIAWDKDKAVSGNYKPPAMPSSIIIDKKGVVRYVHAGYHDGDEVEEEKEIKTLLAE
jgi:cytochrome c biogenesis protein CcmG/thiol:disulfide interchange protein DsbE